MITTSDNEVRIKPKGKREVKVMYKGELFGTYRKGESSILPAGQDREVPLYVLGVIERLLMKERQNG